MQIIDRNKLLPFALAVLAIAIAVLAIPPLRIAVAFALVFYIPGYAILHLFRRDATTTLDRVLYASGLSLAVVIAGGLLLHIFGSMTPVGWAILLSLVSAIALAYRAPPRRQPATDRPHSPNPWRVSGLEALMFIGAALLAFGAVAIDRREAMAHSEFKYTEFWMVSQDPGRPNAFTIGVKNAEGEQASYDVEYMIDGQIAGRFPQFHLQPGEVWTSALSAEFKTGRTQRVEAWLFKSGDNHTVYRRVWADIGRQ